MKNEPIKDILLLYVEDDEHTRLELEQYLKKRVENVIVAKNGEEGLELYNQHKPDIVITDIMMPKMTGLQMCEKIRLHDDKTTIIITSAYSDNENLVEAIKLGINTFLIKPINLIQLYCTLKIIGDKILLERKNNKTNMDLTQAQEKLVETDKMASLGKLVAGVTHELNTPLGIGVSSISHLLSLTKKIKKDYDDDEMTQESFEDFLSACEELSKITYLNLDRTSELIKSFKTIAVDQTNEEERTFNIKEYIDEIVFSLHFVLKKTKVNVEVKCQENITISSYPGLFYQIFSNLITNSLRHGFEKNQEGLICIEVSKLDNELLLVYKDDGKGVASENMDKLFQPFFTTKKEEGGTGLGLCIIKEIVTLKLGGSIDYSSKEGFGVVFTMRIPL